MNSIKFYVVLIGLLANLSFACGLSAHSEPRKIADGFYESQLERDDVTIYLYHRLIESDEEAAFWRAFAPAEDSSRGMQAIYGSIFYQGEGRGIQYNEQVYAWMRTQGVADPEQTLSDARCSLDGRGIDQEGLRKLLAAYRGGVAGFRPSQGCYVVFATKTPIDAPYELLADQSLDPEAQDNILMVYSSWSSDNGGFEHRGIIRNLHQLINPDRRYRGLALPLHSFGADVERIALEAQYLTVNPLGYMAYLLMSGFPEAYLYGDIALDFRQQLAQGAPYEACMAEALQAMSEQEPLDLDEFRSAEVEQKLLIIDLARALG